MQFSAEIDMWSMGCTDRYFWHTSRCLDKHVKHWNYRYSMYTVWHWDMWFVGCILWHALWYSDRYVWCTVWCWDRCSVFRVYVKAHYSIQFWSEIDKQCLGCTYIYKCCSCTIAGVQFGINIDVSCFWGDIYRCIILRHTIWHQDRHAVLSVLQVHYCAQFGAEINLAFCGAL